MYEYIFPTGLTDLGGYRPEASDGVKCEKDGEKEQWEITRGSGGQLFDKAMADPVGREVQNYHFLLNRPWLPPGWAREKGADWHPYLCHCHWEGRSQPIVGNATLIQPLQSCPRIQYPDHCCVGSKSVPLKIVSPEATQRGSGIKRRLSQALTASYQLCDLGPMSPPCTLPAQVQNAVIPGQAHSPLSKPKGQTCFQIQNFLDLRKVIECLCIIVTCRVGLSSKTSIWIFGLNRINSLGPILLPNAFIRLSFLSTFVMK